MSYLLRIFCTSKATVTRGEMAQFIVAGFFFEADPRFEPASDSPTLDDPDWRELEVFYQPDELPIVFSRNVIDSSMKAGISKILTELVDLPAPIRQHLTSSYQVIHIELDEENLSEDAWRMLDHLEPYLMQELDGIIYAPDDGFYDQDMRLVHRL